MTNNDILKKLRVALQLRDEDIVKILALVDFKVTKSELGALFRREDHPHYMECGDQLLRNFLNGLVIYKRGPMERKDEKQPLENKEGSAVPLNARIKKKSDRPDRPDRSHKTDKATKFRKPGRD